VGGTLEALFEYGNPYKGLGNKRSEWAQDLNVKDFSKGEEAQYLYFVGCAASYDDRLRNISRSAIRVFDRAGLDAGILGPEESCCGDLARRLGEDGLLEDVVRENHELFLKRGIRDVVMTCPHGLKMFRDEYPRLIERLDIEPGQEFNVQHHTELLSAAIREGSLKFAKDLPKRVTYHDPCYLGRHLSIYEPPREIIQAIPGVEFVEMEQNRRQSFCCGGGGGRAWIEEFESREKIPGMRVRQAAEVGAEILITSCPYCLSMLEDATKTSGHGETMEVRDLIEVIADLV
jgi:Fe-S oxidoreductase